MTTTEPEAAGVEALPATPLLPAATLAFVGPTGVEACVVAAVPEPLEEARVTVEARGVDVDVVVVVGGGAVGPLPDETDPELVTDPAEVEAVTDEPPEPEPPEPEPLDPLPALTDDDAVATEVEAVALTPEVDAETETLAETGAVGSPPACAGSANAREPKAAAKIESAWRMRGDGRSFTKSLSRRVAGSYFQRCYKTKPTAANQQLKIA